MEAIKFRFVMKGATQYNAALPTEAKGATINRQVADIATLLVIASMSLPKRENGEKMPMVEIAYNGKTEKISFNKDAIKLTFALLLAIGKVIFADCTTFEGKAIEEKNAVALHILSPFKWKAEKVSFAAYQSTISFKLAGLQKLVRVETLKGKLLDKPFAKQVALATLTLKGLNEVVKGISEGAQATYTKLLLQAPVNG